MANGMRKAVRLLNIMDVEPSLFMQSTAWYGHMHQKPRDEQKTD